ncbi:RHS repeat-associated core domain-containing protein [Pseudomonas japonica]|uniref:RHS repeat-associated core domain-containing protein n=1 Tax=Pseudomonas japonica TaxID=256466 RepID=UPI003801D7FF
MMQAPTDTRTLLLVTDRQHTPLREVDGADSRALVHSPYGNRPETHPALSHLGFTGQLREPWDRYQLGNGHRLYNPALMRFHSPDRHSPFERGGLNAYAYCGGDPVNHTDSSGRFIDGEQASPLLTMFLHSGLMMGSVFGMFFTKMKGPLQLANGASILGSGLSLVGGGAALGGADGAQNLISMGTMIAGLVGHGRFAINARGEYKKRHPMANKPTATEAPPPTPDQPWPPAALQPVAGTAPGLVQSLPLSIRHSFVQKRLSTISTASLPTLPGAGGVGVKDSSHQMRQKLKVIRDRHAAQNT